MADEKIDPIEKRLREWGWWLSQGRGGAGFPTKNILHESWLPPTPGGRPMMAVSAGSDHEQRETHRIVGGMSMRMANTLVVVYVYRLAPAEQAERLDCTEGAVRGRLDLARKRIRAALAQEA